MNKKLFIDLGAYEGDSIDKFYNQVKDAADYDIIAFEPDPNIFEVLNRNITSHGYRGITTINMAVGIHTGVANLFVSKTYDGRGSTLLYNKVTSEIDYKNPIEVKCINFCDWFKQVESKYDYIVLKINIEGSEYGIIRELLARKMVGEIDYYCIHFHSSRFDKYKYPEFETIEDTFIREVKRLGISLRVNRNSFDKNNKPEILWVCETPGWAYDKVATELSLRLSQFRHTKLYLSESKGFRGARGMGKAADLIFCFYPQYMGFFDDLSKMVTQLSGFRAFEDANNTQYRECQELELVPGNDTINKKVSAKI